MNNNYSSANLDKTPDNNRINTAGRNLAVQGISSANGVLKT